MKLDTFLEAAPPGAKRALQVLSAAESLTDDAAKALYKIAPIEGVSADAFVSALHYQT